MSASCPRVGRLAERRCIFSSFISPLNIKADVAATSGCDSRGAATSTSLGELRSAVCAIMHHVSWLVSLRSRGASVTRHRFCLAPLPWPARRWVSMSHEKGDVLTWRNVSLLRAGAGVPWRVTGPSSRKSELHMISCLLPNSLSHVILKSDVRLGSWWFGRR